VEALLRWNHPRHGVMRPDEFCRGEATDFIVPLGEGAAPGLLRHGGPHGRPPGLTDLSMSVNISARQLAPQHRRDRGRGAARHRHGRAETGAHRDHGHGEPGAHCPAPARHQGPGRPRSASTTSAPATRPCPPAELPHRHHQGGQELCGQDGHKRRAAQDRAVSDLPGPQPGPECGGQGHRDASSGHAQGAGLPERSGFLFSHPVDMAKLRTFICKASPQVKQ
jgi:hypothetical protein